MLESKGKIFYENKNALSEAEFHCIARMLQSAAFSKEGMFAGCAFCKYPCRKNGGNTYESVMRKIHALTGVDTRIGNSKGIAPNGFSYRRFLLNSNDQIKERLKEHFGGVL